MAGFNGTGPNGMGPMTGGARGYCAMPAGSVPAGIGFGSRGRGGGGGRGRGFRNRFFATGLPGWIRGGRSYESPYNVEMTSEQEARMLKDEASYLKQQMEDIQSRINTLESKGQKKEEK